MISNTLKWIKSKLTILIIVAIVIGMLVGYNFNVSYIKSYTTYVLFFMLYPMMINISFIDIYKSIKNYKPLIYSILLNFLVSPIVAFVIGKLFLESADPMLFTGLMLVALIPTSGMTASWTGLAKGNLQLSVVMIPINLLLSIFVIPIYMQLFLGEIVAIDTMIIINNLLKVVVIPLVLGIITREIIVRVYGMKKYKDIKPNLGGVSALSVIVMVFIAIALKSKTIINNPKDVLIVIVAMAIYYIIIMSASHFIGNKLLSREDRISLVYSTTVRNLTIALGLAMVTFGDSLAALLVAVGYTVQLPFAAFYMKRQNKLKKPE